jgi:hypothetical protein
VRAAVGHSSAPVAVVLLASFIAALGLASVGAAQGVQPRLVVFEGFYNPS